MSSGTPASDTSFDGGAPIPAAETISAAETPPPAPSPDPILPCSGPCSGCPARHHNESPSYDLTNDRSRHKLYLELDFHLPSFDHWSGSTVNPLSDFFDMETHALTTDYSMRMQDSLRDALASSINLSPSERVFLTTQIQKNNFSLHYMLYGCRC